MVAELRTEAGQVFQLALSPTPLLQGRGTVSICGSAAQARPATTPPFLGARGCVDLRLRRAGATSCNAPVFRGAGNCATSPHAPAPKNNPYGTFTHTALLGVPRSSSTNSMYHPDCTKFRSFGTVTVILSPAVLKSNAIDR